VGDPAAETGRGGVGVVEVDRVSVAGCERELLQLLVADHHQPFGAIADGNAHMYSPPLMLRQLPVM
jgi:hypothetical protein